MPVSDAQPPIRTPVETSTSKKPTKTKSQKAKRPTKSPTSPAGGAEQPPGTMNPPINLLEYLGEVTRTITSLFRDRDADRQRFLARCAQVGRENEQLRAKSAESDRQVDVLTAELEEARNDVRRARVEVDEGAARLRELEAKLAASQEAARVAEERASHRDNDLEDALREIEDTERRASDKIHRAQKQRDLGVKTFMFDLRRRIEPLLSEVLDDEQDRPELGSEQLRLRQRLRKILGVLREAGVMGD